MPNGQRERATRYETIVATFVGISALAVSAYTAHVQRQQVRAAVWPILEFNTSNDPMIKFTLDNKGVGPAIIRHVIVTVDGQPVLDWQEALQKLFGPGHYKFSESTMNGHVLSANESMTILEPHDNENAPLSLGKGGPFWEKLYKVQDRARVGIEICYCSTLGECWTLRSDGKGSNTSEESRACPARSATGFQQ